MFFCVMKTAIGEATKYCRMITASNDYNRIICVIFPNGLSTDEECWLLSSPHSRECLFTAIPPPRRVAVMVALLIIVHQNDFLEAHSIKLYHARRACQVVGPERFELSIS